MIQRAATKFSAVAAPAAAAAKRERDRIERKSDAEDTLEITATKTRKTTAEKKINK